MSKEKKRLLIVLSILLFSFLIMTYQYNVGIHPSIPILSYPFDIVKNLLTNTRQSIMDFFSTYHENKKLKEEIRQLSIERLQYGEIINENKRLKELLAFKHEHHKVVCIARVVGRSYDRLLMLMTINKGANDGIKKGMAVISTKGLVGKIHEVKASFSDILLLRDSNFSVSVRVQESRVEGVLSGTGLTLLNLNYIPPEETVEKGNIIITSGLDGIFPSGIPIGVVHSVNKENVEFFQNIKVVPYQYDTRLEEVIVISNTPH
ncbi:MAG: rod shape-determining protein MreC [Thermodesulfovibrionales bacterium]|nr:rod shape-determining protein MreC [Thermodesulfovibrionales bacterium]